MLITKRNEEYAQGEKVCDLFFFDGSVDDHLYLLNRCTKESRENRDYGGRLYRRSDWEVIDLVEDKKYFFCLHEHKNFEEGDF